ncbi:MAG: hypothetical protein KME21_28995 [Desmonostoc vinosum HA7617-LM4]|jgi:hypothetical protein|nr:hypothetical protein [Desmonostoc vinosum HA7617-LM4]
MQTKSQPQDDIKLSTLDHQKLETIIYERIQQDKDISQQLQVLTYLTNKDIEQQRYKILKQETQEKLVFGSLQRVFITAFAILGMFAFFERIIKPSPASGINTLPGITRQR